MCYYYQTTLVLIIYPHNRKTRVLKHFYETHGKKPAIFDDSFMKPQ